MEEKRKYLGGDAEHSILVKGQPDHSPPDIHWVSDYTDRARVY